MHTFHTVDGPIGSFKTLSLLEDRRTNPRPMTIATQTNSLSDQYGVAEGLDIEMICREDRPDGDPTAASEQYRARIKANPKGDFVVNQQVAIACQDADPDREYAFDEIPTVFEVFKFNNLPLSQDFVAGWLASNLCDHSEYYLMEASDHIRNIAEHGWKDDLIKDADEVIKLAQRITSPHYWVYVEASSFLAFKNSLPKQLIFFVVARPSLFPVNTSIIGANFDRTLMRRIWDVSEDVEFIPHPTIKAKHADLSHKAGQTTLLYVGERNFAKAKIDEKNSPTSFAKIAKATGKAIAREFDNQPFIYCTNSRYEHVKWAGPNGTLVSSNSRGWNGGRDFHMAVFLAAINFDPATINFLKKMYGIDGEAAKFALTYESAYQFAGRTSWRVKSCDEPVTLIFGDRATARAMMEFMPGASEPKLLDIGIPELLFPDDDTEKAEKPVKVEKTAEETTAEYAKNNTLKNRRKRIISNHQDTIQYDRFNFRFWAHFSSDEMIESALEWADIVEYFSQYSRNEDVSVKENNRMYREGVFFDNANHLLVDNIQSSKLVILDLDKVSGDVNELSKYLKTRKISNLIVNTFSCVNSENYSERDIRVRVLIPLNEAVDAEHYSRIIRLLAQDIEVRFPEQFRVDGQCMSINNRFYSPCRPSKGEPIFIDGTYFDYDVTRFQKSKPVFLDAAWCMVRTLPEDLEAVTVKRHTKSGVRKAAEDIVLECAMVAGSGNGDSPFYDAAVELIKAGYSRDEAVAALNGKERLFGSGKGRNAARAVNHVVSKQTAVIALAA